jgi:hypothetical protein
VAAAADQQAEEEKAEGREEKKKEVEQPQQQEEEDGVDDASLVKGAVQVFERRVSEFAQFAARANEARALEGSRPEQINLVSPKSIPIQTPTGGLSPTASATEQDDVGGDTPVDTPLPPPASPIGTGHLHMRSNSTGSVVSVESNGNSSESNEFSNARRSSPASPSESDAESPVVRKRVMVIEDCDI